MFLHETSHQRDHEYTTYLCYQDRGGSSHETNLGLWDRIVHSYISTQPAIFEVLRYAQVDVTKGTVVKMKKFAIALFSQSKTEAQIQRSVEMC